MILGAKKTIFDTKIFQVKVDLINICKTRSNV